MSPLTYETLNRNPELLEALLAEARRERARAVNRLLIQPIARLFSGHTLELPGVSGRPSPG